MRLQLGEAYYSTLGGLAKKDTKVLIPANLTEPDALLDSLGLPAETEAGTSKRGVLR